MMKNKNYCVVEWMNGNGFEDDEGVSVLSVKMVKSKKEGELYLEKKVEEVKEMMNGGLNLMSKMEYMGYEGDGYWEGGEFVFKMESESGWVIKEIE